MKKRLAAVLLAASLLCGCAERTEENSSDTPDISDSGKPAVVSADELEYKEENGSVILTKYVGDKTEFAIPAQINGKPVTEIGNKAFCGNTDLKHVDIPDTVTKFTPSDSLKFYEGEEQNDDKIVVTGLDISRVNVYFDEIQREYVVMIEFNEDGTKKFAEATKRLVGEKISIRLDDECIMAPTVSSEIFDGQTVITGAFTADEAYELAGKMIGNPFIYCKKAEVIYKGKTYSYNELNELCLNMR